MAITKAKTKKVSAASKHHHLDSLCQMKLKTLTLGHTKLLLRWLSFACMWKRETETQAQVNFYAFHSLGLVNSDLRIRNTSRCTTNRWNICHCMTNSKAAGLQCCMKSIFYIIIYINNLCADFFKCKFGEWSWFKGKCLSIFVCASDLHFSYSISNSPVSFWMFLSSLMALLELNMRDFAMHMTFYVLLFMLDLLMSLWVCMLFLPLSKWV